MKKHTIAALACVLGLLQVALPVADLAVMAEDKLTYGALTYQTEDGCITITGCDASAEAVEIPSEIDGMAVTKIGSTAFYGSSLTSIVIPEGVTDIGSGAFWHSKSLTEVSLPSTLTTIEGNAFNDCQSLETLSFPESLTTIGTSVFEDTPWLAAQKEQSPFVIVNNILIDASEYVSTELAKIQEERDQAIKDALEGKIWKRASIMTNQVGYFTNLNKKATLLSEEKAGVKFELLDADGKAVFTGTSKPFGFDADSGDQVHILDFSEFKTEGTYTLKAETGEESKAFEIGVTDNYSGLLYDALNYFYQARSGIEIEEQYITSGDAAALARAAGHVTDLATIQNVFGYEASSGTQEVSGGWYDAGDHGKYVVNGGISLWLMQNQYERAALKGTSAAYEDGVMKLPENGNGYPDLLDEARYEMEWMLKMIVQDGECEGMAYHKVHDAKWTALGLPPAKDTEKRYLMPPSTAATLNLAATGAQAYRLWKDLDPAFAEECLNAAINAYEAAKAHPDMYAPNQEWGGGGAYNDDYVEDEFYWAASELYVSTGDESYYTDLKNSVLAFAVPDDMNGKGTSGLTGTFDWGNTAALGSFTLMLHKDMLSAPEVTALNKNLFATADGYLAMEAAQGYGLPYKGNPGYTWGSNSFVSDNAIVLAYAYDESQNADYLNGAVSALDYLLGRNPMDISYVTGYGEHTSQYPHHRYWAISVYSYYPKAPCGVLVGGPNTGLEDNIVQDQGWEDDGTAPQKYYVDDIEAYSVNECAVNWNSSLAWIAGYLCEQNDGIIPGHASAGEQMPEVEVPVYDPNETILVSVELPEGITAVGEQIFGSKYKKNVSEVIVPENVTNIGKQAFFDCKNLETITLPDTLETIGQQAFAKTPWLTEMLADSPMLIINGLLIDGSAASGDVEIPEGVTAILGNAFYMNTKLTSIIIPEGVETIGAEAFNGCSALESVVLPEGLTTIKANAFADTSLTELTIPSTVTKVESQAFINCKELSGVTIKSTEASIGTEAFGCTFIYTATGQYSYIFVHGVLEDFVVTCDINSTAASFAENTGLETEFFGDVNRDKKVSLADVVLLNKNLMIGEAVTTQGLNNADVDCNGETDEVDSLNILKYIIKLVTAFPMN